MAEGSSSAAPVISPRPAERNTPSGTGVEVRSIFRASVTGSYLRRLSRRRREMGMDFDKKYAASVQQFQSYVVGKQFFAITELTIICRCPSIAAHNSRPNYDADLESAVCLLLVEMSRFWG